MATAPAANTCASDPARPRPPPAARRLAQVPAPRPDGHRRQLLRRPAQARQRQPPPPALSGAARVETKPLIHAHRRAGHRRRHRLVLAGSRPRRGWGLHPMRLKPPSPTSAAVPPRVRPLCPELDLPGLRAWPADPYPTSCLTSGAATMWTSGACCTQYTRHPSLDARAGRERSPYEQTARAPSCSPPPCPRPPTPTPVLPARRRHPRATTTVHPRRTREALSTWPSCIRSSWVWTAPAQTLEGNLSKYAAVVFEHLGRRAE